MKHHLQRAVILTMLLGLMGVIVLPAVPASAAGISMFTKYSGIAVTPGESINYIVDVINNSNSIQTVSLQVVEQPEDWEVTLTSGVLSISQLSVKPQSEESFNMQIGVPLQVERAAIPLCSATDAAGGVSTLPITIEVTEQGTFKTELETEQPSRQGTADSKFEYKVTLRNRTAEEQLYALSAAAPRGWSVQFEVSNQKVTSVKVDANSTKDISVTIDPPGEIEAGTYTIPVMAQAGSFSAEEKLEVQITGTYQMELTTPTGRLSTDITAGREKMVELQLNNTGSSELIDIKLNQAAPVDWEVRFEPENISSLLPGESTTVKAYIKASGKAIAGDYVVNLKAQTPEASDSVDFRITVETSALWGWIGVLIIALVVAGIYYLFRRYGRQ